MNLSHDKEIISDDEAKRLFVTVCMMQTVLTVAGEDGPSAQSTLKFESIRQKWRPFRPPTEL